MGVHVEQERITVAATDFPGQLVHAVESIPLHLEKTEESVRQMCLAVKKCLESKMRIDSSAVAGYGVDITGRVNHGTGYSYSFFISEEKPFRDLLEAEFGKPVVVENDSRAMAWGEYMSSLPGTEGDILVGFNVNQIDAAEIQGYLDSREAISRESDHSLLGRIQAGLQTRQLEESGRQNWIPVDASDNFYTVLQRSFGIMNCSLSRMGIELTPPDVLISLPYDSYHGVYGYSHAREIAELGRRLTAEALDAYEKKDA